MQNNEDDEPVDPNAMQYAGEKDALWPAIEEPERCGNLLEKSYVYPEAQARHMVEVAYREGEKKGALNELD